MGFLDLPDSICCNFGGCNRVLSIYSAASKTTGNKPWIEEAYPKEIYRIYYLIHVLLDANHVPDEANPQVCS